MVAAPGTPIPGTEKLRKSIRALLIEIGALAEMTGRTTASTPVAGDTWTWTTIETDNKLIVSRRSRRRIRDALHGRSAEPPRSGAANE
jgi:hypothetical protein